MPGDFYRLTPREFEDAVARLLRSQGYGGVQRIGGAGDLGVDIRCRDQDGNLVVVQCKRYAPDKRIGSPMIQQFMAMALHHGAQHKLFVTTARYTPAAVALARDAGVELIDGQGLVALIRASEVRTEYAKTRNPVMIPDDLPGTGYFDSLRAFQTWLEQLPPDVPVTSAYPNLTDDQRRSAAAIRERLFALTPEGFRKSDVLKVAALFDNHDRPGLRPLDNANASIKDYVEDSLPTMRDDRPIIVRCHHLPPEQSVTAEDVTRFVRFAESEGYQTRSYHTTSFFTVGAKLKGLAAPGYLSTVDGWSIAVDFALASTDFVALALSSPWPENVERGTAKRTPFWKRLFG